MSTQTPQVEITQLRIRTAERSDLPAMEWNGEYSHFRRLYQDIYQSYRRGEAVLWVAELENGSLIGQLFVQLNSARPELADGGSRAYIYGFRIQEPYRNQGIGSLMLQIAEDDLRKRGYRKVILNVNQDNPDARRLYERSGYQVTATEDGTWSYHDEHGRLRQVKEPAWRMEKELDGRGD